MTFLNLPNVTPAPNENNLTAEAERYYQLYNSLNRSETGTATFSSSSSGVTYSTNNYVDDPDVYNKGQLGLMNLLYKYVLKSYIVIADVINDTINRSNSDTFINATGTFNEGNLTYDFTLEYEPTTTVYTIRFKAPNNFVERSIFNLKYTTESGSTLTDVLTPVLSGTSERMPSNTFMEGRVITANADRTTNTLTFDSSSAEVFIKSATAPEGQANQNKIWLNTTNGTLNYYDGTTWVGIVGVWG